jgi:pilus assembly protein CpaE
VGDIDEITVTESICRRLPFVQIIILSTHVDPNYMRRAMLAGARDFLVKPPSPDELRSAVYRAGSLAHDRRASSMYRGLPPGPFAPEAQKTRPLARGRIVQVYSPKGGAGTTTIATNLAIKLHSNENRAVLVDGNLQYGDVAIFLDELGYHSILDLVPRVNDLDPEVIESVVVPHSATGLHIMAAPNRPELADKVSGEDFFKILQYLRRVYSYVVVDTPTGLNDVTLACVDAADLFVVITSQEIAAVKNTRLFLSLVDGLHISREKIVLVMNRYDKRIALTPEKVAENLKQPVVSVVPLQEQIVSRAANQGKPFVLANKTEPVARAVVDLAETVRNRLATLDVESAQAGGLAQNATLPQ